MPANVNDILDLIKLASNWMFGLFLTGTCLSFALIFLMPVSVYSRWLALVVAILAFLNALFVTVAAVVATVMFVIFRNVIGGVSELNIHADIGITMFVFMWIASAFTIFACLVQISLCCCCASRRDVKNGRKRGSEKAYQMSGLEAADGGVRAAEHKEAAAPPPKKKFWQRA